MSRRLTACISIVLLAACAEEPKPRSVHEFLENPILLEATMVRCSQDRSKSKYEAECVNARQAVAKIQAREEAERQKELEARSERKRKALRRTQQAAAEARRRAAESERRRKEAEYLAQFGVLPPAEGEGGEALQDGNLPIAVVPDAPDQQPADTGYAEIPPQDAGSAAVPPPVPSGSNAPTAEPAPEPAPEPEAEQPTDLASIRDELRRRSEQDDN